MDFRPKYKMRNYKFINHNIKENLDDLRSDNDFLDITQKAWSIKEIDKLDFIKNKNVCSTKQCQQNENNSHRLE